MISTRSLRDRFNQFRYDRARDGAPDLVMGSPLGLVHDVLRWGRLGRYVWHSRRIRGWMRGGGKSELAKAAYSLPASAVIVEIGTFLGCSTVLLAGARKLRGSGQVHCVDTFASSGDAFSVPIYQAIADSLGVSTRERFEENMRTAGVEDWIVTHEMDAAEAARNWRDPIDLLFLDGDQTREGAREAYLTWSAFLRQDAVLVIDASADGPSEPGHDGSMHLVREFLHPPHYHDVRCVDGLTFAISKVGRAEVTHSP